MRSENSVGSSNTHMSTMQAGSRCIVARWAGGLEWRGFMLRCRRWLGPSAVPATDGASRTGSGPSQRNKVDTTFQPPTSNSQQDTRRKRFQPLLFSTEHMRRLRCRRVDDSPSRARQRSEDGHWARPPVPTAPLPSLRCPAAGSHLSRNASRVGRDRETPMRIDPQGPHSSTARPLSTRSIPT